MYFNYFSENYFYNYFELKRGSNAVDLSNRIKGNGHPILIVRETQLIKYEQSS